MRKYIPELRRNQPAFKVPFGYGFAYKDISSFGSYYYLFPLNLLAKLIHTIKQNCGSKE